MRRSILWPGRAIQRLSPARVCWRPALRSPDKAPSRSGRRPEWFTGMIGLRCEPRQEILTSFARHRVLPDRLLASIAFQSPRTGATYGDGMLHFDHFLAVAAV